MGWLQVERLEKPLTAGLSTGLGAGEPRVKSGIRRAIRV